MKRVTGIGGIFFKTENPELIRSWYAKHLGIGMQDQHGAVFTWGKEGTDEKGSTVWSPFKKTTTYFQPSEKDFMFNYRVENLEALLALLKEEGVQIVGEMEVYEYGKFGWIMDPEGNKIELWEPVDAEFSKMNDNANPGS
jgi:predicted enzyme related to lactoylglutathione lyase